MITQSMCMFICHCDRKRRVSVGALSGFYLVTVLSACGGFFRPIPAPIPFDTKDTPTGQGWYCAFNAYDGSYCERDLQRCASKQSSTPETSACVAWEKPAFCYSYVVDSGMKYIECHATIDFCTARSDSWRSPAPSSVDRERVSMCLQVP